MNLRVPADLFRDYESRELAPATATQSARSGQSRRRGSWFGSSFCQASCRLSRRQDEIHEQRLLVIVIVIIKVFIIIAVDCTNVHPIIGIDSHFFGNIREFLIALKQRIGSMNLDLFDLKR